MKLQGYQADLSAPSAPVLENTPPLPVGSPGQVLLWADGAPAWSELPSGGNPFNQPLNTTDDPTFLSGSFASLFDASGGNVANADYAATPANADYAVNAANATYANSAGYASFGDAGATIPTFFGFAQGAPIADQVGTVSVASFNAVLAILRAMLVITT